jgi:beta-N-acetylhexosaminidase
MAPLRWRGPVAAAVLAVLLAGCSAPATDTASSSDETPTSAVVPAPSILDGLSLEQRVGQLFMVGSPANYADSATVAAVRDRFVGSVFLSGRSSAGVVATAGVVTALGAENPGGIPLFVATDQEGGQVQVLSGPGFSAIPTARTQGKMDPAALAEAAQLWGGELLSAGVNFNLAPVGDIVTGPNSNNQPIAHFRREYGYDAATVSTQAGAFVQGMAAAGVSSTLKHFPGLGYVQGNTDVVASVTDTVTAADSPSVESFGALIDAGAPVVMMSSAVYALIDPAAPAVFSPTVVGVLRNDLGFVGIVITDDFSGAAAVQAWSPADRAILAIQAGVDIVLVVHPAGVLDEMVDAVVAKAADDPAFAALVDAAARRVLLQKIIVGAGI